MSLIGDTFPKEVPMRVVLELLFRLLAMFLIVVALHGVALGDIPPPPPEIPGTEFSMPGPAATAIGGLLITVAVAWAAVKSGRTPDSSPSKVAVLAATLLLTATIAATIFSFMEHEGYRERRDNWVPNGPVD